MLVLIALIAMITINLFTPRASTPLAHQGSIKNIPDDASVTMPVTTPDAIYPLAMPAPEPAKIIKRSGRSRRVIDNAPGIEIDDINNKVLYQNFDQGEPWNMTIGNATTGAITYRFNETIGEQNTADKTWYVWLGNPGERYGIQKCIFPGSYDIYATGIHGGNLIEKNGFVGVSEQEACIPAVPPMPELATGILVGAGLLGIIGYERLFR